MTSAFDTAVAARRKHTPWAHVSLTGLMRELALTGPGRREVLLTCRYRPDVSSGFWWELRWDGQEQSAAGQELDLALWRAAETILSEEARTKERRP